jgi:hypothetical protein
MQKAKANSQLEHINYHRSQTSFSCPCSLDASKNGTMMGKHLEYLDVNQNITVHRTGSQNPSPINLIQQQPLLILLEHSTKDITTQFFHLSLATLPIQWNRIHTIKK